MARDLLHLAQSLSPFWPHRPVLEPAVSLPRLRCFQQPATHQRNLHTDALVDGTSSLGVPIAIGGSAANISESTTDSSDKNSIHCPCKFYRLPLRTVLSLSTRMGIILPLFGEVLREEPFFPFPMQEERHFTMLLNSPLGLNAD